jgi:class 3 adenylate cyclase
MRAFGLMATQTLTFLFTDIDGSAPMGQRLGSAYARGLADHHRLIRAARAAHGR